MTVTPESVIEALERLSLPDGGTLRSRDMLRALRIEGSTVSFVIEADSPQAARALAPVRDAAERLVRALPGITAAQVVLTAHGPAAPPPDAPSAPRPASGPRIGQHPTAGGARPAGVDRLLLVGSGKGGVGKSTVSSNLAVALARQGRRVGLLDADIYGPSQPRMMGAAGQPGSPDGKIILPLQAHGVTMMSIGFLLAADQAVIWRGPMLMGALQQLLSQVRWGALDVLIVDMPPGTGDVQLTLCQKAQPDGAIVVSTPQDVALLDARKALSAFRELKTPVLGLIENMSTYVCPACGHEADIFGAGGVEAEARALDLPFLGRLPLSLEVRLAGDAGTPVAAGAGPMADAYAAIAQRLVAEGLA